MNDLPLCGFWKNISDSGLNCFWSRLVRNHGNACTQNGNIGRIVATGARDFSRISAFPRDIRAD